MRNPVCAVMVLSLLVGCVSGHEVPVGRVLTQYADELDSAEGLPTDGYVTTSGIEYDLEVNVRRAGDHLIFSESELEYSRPKISEVRGIYFDRVDPGKTAGNTGKGVLVTLGIILLAVVTLGLSLA